MKTEINWWELDKNEIFLLDKESCDFILTRIKERHKNINKFRNKLNIGREIYQSIIYKNQGINNWHLQTILSNIDFNFSDFNNKIIGIGKYKSGSFTFPVVLLPQWSCLLAHSFFDGYADKYIMRYANYDGYNRKEFETLIEKIFGDKLYFNSPENFRRDINLPSIVPRLLMKFFDVKSFYSRECRIPKSLYELTKIDKLYGFYFLKGAYIDEGSVSGGQIWIVRGIVNKPLAKDIMKLCNILGIDTRLKLSSKFFGGYSVGVKKESFDMFFDNLKLLFWNKNKKLLKLEEFMVRHRTPLERDNSGRFLKRDTK